MRRSIEAELVAALCELLAVLRDLEGDERCWVAGRGKACDAANLVRCIDYRLAKSTSII